MVIWEGQHNTANVKGLINPRSGSSGTDHNQMSGCVAAAVASAGLNKELDANRFSDSMRVQHKTLLTSCAEVSHLD